MSKPILISPLTIEAIKIAIVDMEEALSRIKREIASAEKPYTGAVLDCVNNAVEMREQSCALFANIISRYEANHDQRQS